MKGRNKIPKSARKAGAKGNNKRWKKGQSSSSNPETVKYRQNARSRFFNNQKSGPSDLTIDAITKHNQAHRDTDPAVDIDNEDAISDHAKTFNTWATNWTDCTNATFSRVHRFWSSNSEMHKELLAVLAAITEVIKSRGGKETETEYFAALMTSIESVDTEESLAAIVYLLSLVIKRLPFNVLKAKFSEIAKTFYEVLSQHADSNHTSFLKSIFKCLAQVFRVQDAVVWNDSSTTQMFNGLLSFAIHTKPKVRKGAQEAVCALLKGSPFMSQPNAPSHHPAAALTARFCVKHIEESGGLDSSTTTLHVLGFLKNIMGTFPKQSTKSVCEAILRVMTLSNVLITSQAMQALHRMFVSQPKESCLSTELNAQLITALYDYQPQENDIQPSIAWLTVMEKAHLNLAKSDEKLFFGHLPRIYTSCMNCLRTEKPEVADSASQVMKQLLTEGIEPLISSATDGSSPNDSIVKTFRCLEAGLSYQYHSSWGMVLKTLAIAFKVLGKKYQKIMHKALVSMADLRDSFQFAYKGELDHAIGMAIQTMGPRVVLGAIPLQINGDEADNIDFPRSWLLPVLRNNIRNTELAFFISYFLPLAARIRARSTALEQGDRNAESKAYKTIQYQIWLLLGGFCTRPTDIKQSFAGLAKVLGTAISDHMDLRMEVMSALRKLITNSIDDEESRTELSRFAKNYLPILFNVFTTEPADPRAKDYSRLAVLETVKVYLQIADSALVTSFCDKCIERLTDTESSDFRRHAMMDLLIVMIPYINVKQIKKICGLISPHFKSSDKTMQKKTYRIYEEICAANSENCMAYIKKNLSHVQSVLLKTLSTSSASSKAPRLRCLINIFKQLPSPEVEFLETVLPEAILCTREVAERARAAAYNLLVEMGEASLRWSEKSKPDAVTDYLQLVMAGLLGSPHMISTTLHALTRLLFQYKDCISENTLSELMSNMCILLTSKAREIVQAVLPFFKVLLGSFPESRLAKYLTDIVSSLVSMKDECHHHFRFKSKEIFEKLVKKFGFETINRLVPESHSKMLVNIRKTQERQKRKKQAAENAEDSDAEMGEKMPAIPETIEELLRDTDSELENDDKDDNMKGKKKKLTKKAQQGQKSGAAWLKEGGDEEILDFMDPSISKKVLATKPDDKKADKQALKHDFKMAPDGKLIITEDKEESATPSKKEAAAVDDLDELIEAMAGPQKKNRKRKVEDIAGVDDDDNTPAPKYQAGGKGIHRPIKKATRKGPDMQDGTSFKAKKAGGDVKKGKHDPFAYVPLNFQNLNKRKRAKVAGQFSNFVKAAKKGAVKGKKSKAKK
ncbi:RRP12-like protein isoform X2 [Tubulanus polymorphus]|uniref:RRP12-like protein isoform X2 n=1 Tax=Tubulanus polymorphus TaxID=672921 RepID=UPI003DA6A7B9